MKPRLSLALVLALSWMVPASSQTVAREVPGRNAAEPAADWPEAWIEIFKLAPGRQESFMRKIAIADVVSAAGGQPPIRLYVHQDGADWDVLLLKPEPTVKPTPAQEAAMAAKSRELRVPSGPAYFVYIREDVAAHTDTKTYGPLTAGEWLSRLDRWRSENGPAPASPAVRRPR